MTNDVCYVIGSGPSLCGFDFDQLPDGFRIGANKSGWLAKCDAMVSIDRNFHKNFPREIASFEGDVYIAFSGAQKTYPNVTYLEHSREEISWVPGTICGSNSGFAAFNLAILLGYTEIALLGFDFKWDETTSHFHGGYQGQTKKVDQQLAQWCRMFGQVARRVKDRGIRVTNFVGPSGSRINAFPVAPLEELT